MASFLPLLTSASSSSVVFGRIGHRALVVVQRHGLDDARHAVQLAVERRAREGGRREAVGLALDQVIHRGQQLGAHLVAGVVVRRGEHVGAATGRDFSLPLVEDLVERDLQHIDLHIRVFFLKASSA